MSDKNLLFICSRNKRRSLTAEMIWKSDQEFSVKSCGTSPSSRVKVNEKLLSWADIIFVMEKRHKEILSQKYATIIASKIVHVLHIKDVYDLMDEKLVQLLKERVGAAFNQT